MELVWSCGIAHEDMIEQCSPRHLLRLRTDYGRGVEAVAGAPPRPVHWRAGTLEYLPPGLSYGHASEVGSDWIVLAIDDEEWRALAGEAAPVREPVLCAQGARHADPKRVTYQVGQLARDANDGETLALQETMAGLAQAWHRRLWPDGGADARGHPPAGLSGAALKRVLEHVEASVAGTLTLRGLAREAGLSPFHFVSAFRHATGHTPHQYVMARRLSRARRALEAGARSITRVAMDNGFSSHAHLGTVFSGRLGMSPGGYRDLFQHDAGEPRWMRACRMGGAHATLPAEAPQCAGTAGPSPCDG